MPEDKKDERLRAQIEKAAEKEYSTESIDRRIADALCQEGFFHGSLDAGDLAVILRSVVYSLFSNHNIAGLHVRPVHNVSTIKVKITNGEAAIQYLVHLHKPIVAFLEFRYTLINDPVSIDKKIRLKRGSLKYRERTRKFDLKAKAGLAAVNIRELALAELQDISRVIVKTLPEQLAMQSVIGKLKRIELILEGEELVISLEGAFKRIKN